MARNFFSNNREESLGSLTKMKCQNCNEKATVHFTQLEAGSMKKVSYCEQCAIEEGITDLTNFGLNESIFPSPKESLAQGLAENTGACPQCGFTRQKFQQTGRLGCSQCYVTFADEILARLGTMHRGLRHLGKRPSGFKSDPFAEGILQETRERLEEAIQNEHYEEAARLRDEIDLLENGVGDESSMASEGGDNA